MKRPLEMNNREWIVYKIVEGLAKEGYVSEFDFWNVYRNLFRKAKRVYVNELYTYRDEWGYEQGGEKRYVVEFDDKRIELRRESNKEWIIFDS